MQEKHGSCMGSVTLNAGARREEKRREEKEEMYESGDKVR